MCSSSSVSSPFLSLHISRRSRLFLNLSHPFPNLTCTNVSRLRIPKRRLSLSASVTQNNLELSWISPDRGAAEDYNGWAVVEEAVSSKKQKKGFPTFLLLGIGTSIVVFVAVFAYSTLSRKGLVLRVKSGFQVYIESKSLGSDDPLKVGEFDTESIRENVYEVVSEPVEEESNHIKSEEGKPGRVVIPVSADATQQEALSLLKNLKIIEDEVKADELCTRREYARWLVLINSRLERNPKNRIVPSVALAGSTINAFDDISCDDPDFEYIQALAEAGVVPSKLSGKTLTSDLDDSKSSEGVNFFPERIISRQDLISWKAKLDYKVMPGITEEISRKKIGFLDAREIESDVLLVLFMDMLADNKSITRKVFGQVKRFQPGKPCTKAQAAVALSSGRMVKAISCEISKLEAENSSRQFAMKEIRSELLERGEIQRHWEKKLEEERNRGLEVESAYLAALADLEHGKIDQENAITAFLKEKAALDCQKQLLSSLKKEVEEMTERLASERSEYVKEQRNIHGKLNEVEIKHEGVIDAKSILEAEVEAVRILRSWIEDEAKKGQARTKVLEEVSRRWKWGNRS